MTIRPSWKVARSIRSTVVSPREHWALKSGSNWRKIGGEVLKGKWRGFPLYILNLEERATCPTACRHWRSCYANHMQWMQRMEAGPDLEWKLEREVALLAIDHPNFVCSASRRWRLLQRGLCRALAHAARAA